MEEESRKDEDYKLEEEAEETELEKEGEDEAEKEGEDEAEKEGEDEADLDKDFDIQEKKEDVGSSNEVKIDENLPVRSEPEHHFGGHDDDVIKINKDDLYKYSTFILIAVVLIGAFAFFRGGVGTVGTGNVVANPQPSVPQPGQIARVQVSIDDDAVKGDKNAPVTIIEFSDYECPFCGRFYSQTLGEITTKYIDTGIVKYVVRDFPLSFHPQAQKSAEAAECAGEQDKYFEMHDKLFEQGVSGGVASFKLYAGQIGLDQGKFDKCLDSGEMASEVQKDAQDGQSYGVQGTPAFFVNGKLISGAQPFSAFQQAIEAELA